MSQVYLTEPQTTGRVVMETSHGPIDVNLWCTECPTTTRAFLQLCLDGYFNGMIFHRILNDFLIQAGLTRSTDTRPEMNATSSEEPAMEKYMKQYITKEKLADKRLATNSGMNLFNKKKLELSPRIKFNHRGQVALAIPLDSMAGNGGDDGLHPDESISSLLMRQFFITLSEASFLNHKHVIFGTVAGPTIFNAMRIGKTEVDSDGVAVDFENIPKILSVKIDFHPFGDLVVTKDEQIPWKKILSDTSHQELETDVKQRRKHRKGKRDVNVLSFGDEMEDGADIIEDGPTRVQSIHDVISQTKKTKIRTRDGDETDTSSNVIHEKRLNQFPNVSVASVYETTTHAIVSNSISDDIKNQKQMDMNPYNNGSLTLSTATQQSMTTQHHVTQSESVHMNPSHKENDESTRPSAIEARRAKYLNHRHGVLQRDSTREEATLSKLQAFKNKISILKQCSTEEKDKGIASSLVSDESLASRMALRLAREEARIHEKNAPRPSSSVGEGYSGQLLETHFNVDSSSWMKTNFQCKRHMDSEVSMGGDGKVVDEYQVIDTQPRQGGKKVKNPNRDRPHYKASHKM